MAHRRHAVHEGAHEVCVRRRPAVLLAEALLELLEVVDVAVAGLDEGVGQQRVGPGDVVGR
jgi:hypothetical protein